jgi:hypothetical protein
MCAMASTEFLFLLLSLSPMHTHILTRVMQLNMKEFLLTFHFMSSLRPFLLMKDFQEPPKQRKNLVDDKQEGEKEKRWSKTFINGNTSLSGERARNDNKN